MIKTTADLFNYCRNINDYILEKYNNDYSNLSFLDFFVFQLTSYTCALIYRRYYLKANEFSIDSIFIYRSMMENIATIYKYIKDGVTPDEEELLREYSLLAEKAVYSRYKEIFDGEVYNYEDMLDNYNKAKSNYKKAMEDKTNYEFNDIINQSKLPFFKEKIDFHHLIEKYFPQQFENYGLLSIFSHPHDLLCSHTDYIKNYKLELKKDWVDKLDKDILNRVVFIIENVYTETLNIKISKTYKTEAELLSPRFDNVNYLFMETSKQERSILNEIADEINNIKPKDNKGYFLREMGNFIVSIATYHVFGLTEIVKSIYKPAIEQLALDDFIYSSEGFIENPNLGGIIHIHTIYRLFKILLCDKYDKELEEYINLAYKMINKNIDTRNYDNFKKTFYKPLSFINNNPSLNELVRGYFANIKNEESMQKLFNLIYDESQLLSHGNGYMLSSNPGTFLDDEPVIKVIDLLTIISIDKYFRFTALNSITSGADEYKELLNKLNAGIEKLKELFEVKSNLLDVMQQFKLEH